ncbi:ABC transporter ATP-binding protein [Haloechinothrix sp. LS1_15]|uniref:ABC transporter ATP-binding protein n=1 Tax=Haloechinothrix sp. LS1_15 TaxID=2652248 RepID=UPI002947C9CA|nr:ABC transporter ATP-binding protein [Haloechinothrix sp. LS1_15]MDV6011600.1 ABC transporter ATP-binding protein [Haloechinothrix sp. LS1_15]
MTTATGTAAAATAAISCRNLTKRYGELRAVDGVTFEVRQGEIFGIIGPNGAGKTTMMECIEGLRARDEGTVEIFGADPERDPRTVRERIGVQLQLSALPERITVSEALDLFASFYAHPADWRPLLERLGLGGKASSYVEKLSGGQRQRVFIALALVHAPDLVFLDELTTGLDPQARLAIWDVISDIRDSGTTIVLTTHFMAEAERLCDRVAVVDHGTIVALDTIPNLIASLGVDSKLSFTVNGDPPMEALRAVAGVSAVERDSHRIVVRGHGNRFPHDVLGVLADADLWAQDLRTEQPTLEDVFLTLTGRHIREGVPA